VCVCKEYFSVIDDGKLKYTFFYSLFRKEKLFRQRCQKIKLAKKRLPEWCSILRSAALGVKLIGVWNSTIQIYQFKLTDFFDGCTMEPSTWWRSASGVPSCKVFLGLNLNGVCNSTIQIYQFKLTDFFSRGHQRQEPGGGQQVVFHVANCCWV